MQPKSLRVQVPDNHILTQNLDYNYYYPDPKYLIIGYMDPLGIMKSGVSRIYPCRILNGDNYHPLYIAVIPSISLGSLVYP